MTALAADMLFLVLSSSVQFWYISALKTTYHVFVRTGNKLGAGTDANVYITLYGEVDDTGQCFLSMIIPVSFFS